MTLVIFWKLFLLFVLFLCFSLRGRVGLSCLYVFDCQVLGFLCYFGLGVLTALGSGESGSPVLGLLFLLDGWGVSLQCDLLPLF